MSDAFTPDKYLLKIPVFIKQLQDTTSNLSKQMRQDGVFGRNTLQSDIAYTMYDVAINLSAIVSGIVGCTSLVMAPITISSFDMIVGMPIETITSGLVQDVLDEPGIDNKAVNKILNYGRKFEVFPNLTSAITNAVFVLSYMSSLSDYALQEMKYQMNKIFRPNIADPSAAIRASFIAPEKIDQTWEVLRRHGFKDDDIKMMFISAYQTYDVETIKQLFLRKEIGTDKVYERMREIGFTDTRIQEIMKLWTIIPGLQDLLWMVGKEAFEQDQINEYGLGDEFPEAQSSWLEKQGLSRFWQEKYWIAHWDYPSPGQVFEMLHRRKLTRQQVYNYFRVIEMPPYWRDKMMDISYNPYTRVDVRRMHKMGVLGDEDLVNAYMDEGYDLEHAQKMADFTVKYNTDEDKQLTLTQLKNGYKKGIITKAEYKTMLLDIGYIEYSADYVIELTESELQQENVDEIISLIKNQFTHNIIGEMDAYKRLIAVNLTSERIHTLIEQWKVTSVNDDKLPSKADLDKFVLWNIITPENYYSEMKKLGYAEKYINWYTELIMIQVQEQLKEYEE